ncbi:MAG: hypothetical protein GX493_13435 [Firmicutes bacterium]|nr:hypothetical protein [Bacillota bacterium]
MVESLVVLWDGKVVPCGKDFDGSYVVGDLAAGDTLRDIWQNGRMVSLRKVHVDGLQREIKLRARCGEWPGHEPTNPEDSIRALADFQTRKDKYKRTAIYKKNFE